MMQKAIHFARKEFLNDISYTFSFLSRWIGIALSVVTFFYISRFMGDRGYLKEYGIDYFSFVLIGLAGMSYLNSAINGFAATVAREQWNGTLEVLLTTPTPLRVLVVSFALYNFFMGFLAAVLYLLLGCFLGVTFHIASWVALFLVTLLATGAFLGLGLISASSAVIFRKGDPLAWIVANLFWLLGGAYFPITVFPEFIRKVSVWLPTTYALKAWREIFFGNTLPLKEDIKILFLFAGVLLTLGYSLFRWAIHYARKRGTIALC